MVWVTWRIREDSDKKFYVLEEGVKREGEWKKKPKRRWFLSYIAKRNALGKANVGLLLWSTMGNVGPYDPFWSTLGRCPFWSFYVV